MKKIIILGISIFSFFLTAHLAFADLEITQVMYDPDGSDTGKEWIKLYNNGDEVINIISGKTNSSWRFADGKNGENLHYINSDLEIGSKEYAVIASDKDTFLSENSFIGQVADTSMSLVNTGGIVKILDGSNPRKTIVERSYDPGISDSNSGTSSVDLDTNNSNDDLNTEENVVKVPEVYKITTKILISKVLVAGISFPINSLTTDNKKQTFLVGKYVWNFGDGTRREEQGANISEYTYQYPGEYILTLDYYENYSIFTPTPDATNRIIVKVVPSDVYISSVGSGIDSYIEIENKSKYEVALSDWILKGINKSFTIPKGTIVLPNKKIQLSPKITNFNNFDIQNLSLVYPSGEVISQYPVVENKVLASKISANYYPTSSTSGNTNTSNQNDSNIINLNDLGASAESAKEIPSNSTFAYLGLAVILVLGGGAVYFARRGSFIKNDDLENTIRAEDMTIME